MYVKWIEKEMGIDEMTSEYQQSGNGHRSTTGKSAGDKASHGLSFVFIDIPSIIGCRLISTLAPTERSKEKLNLDHIFINFETSRKPYSSVYAKRRGLSDHFLIQTDFNAPV